MTGLWETQGVRRDHIAAGDTAAEEGMDVEVDPMAKVLTSDTQSITSTSTWLLGEPHPAPFHFQR